MGKMHIVEMGPEEMMEAMLNMAEIMSRMKKEPRLLVVMPDDPMAILITFLEVACIKSTEQKSKDSPRPSKEDVDKAVQTAMDALLKAAGK